MPNLHPTQIYFSEYRNSFRGIKRPGRETEHSLSSSAEVKNAGSYTSTSTCFTFAWCLILNLWLS